jgi:transcriptional regulator with XRE-family HTH domain
MIKQINEPMGVSGRILQVLLDRGMSQSQIASKLGVHRSHISRIKSGEHEFTDAQLDRIETLTGVPLGLLLLGSEPPATASREVRQVYREAVELMRRSEIVQKKLDRLARCDRLPRRSAMSA